MNNLQNNATFNQSSATFNFASLSDATPEFFNLLQNLESVSASEQLLDELCFEIAGKCDQWAIVSLMMLFNSLSTIQDAQTRAECLQTVCFKWTNEAAAAEYAFVGSLRGNQTQAEPTAEPSQSEPPSVENSPENADTKQMALALSELLNNPNLPRRIYDGIADGINETFNDLTNSKAVADSPEYIEKVLKSYKNQTQAAERAEYAQSIADTTPLDLSEMSADDLGTNDKIKEVAQCLSGILQDRSLPELLRDGVKSLVVDGLFNEINNHENAERIEESPEYIEALLKDVAKFSGK